MNGALSRNVLVLVVLFLAMSAFGHIGSPNVFFDGVAGPYPVHVVIQPPNVIPGQAEITVRVETNGTHQVTVLPIRWNTGKGGAPRADVAEPVRGDTNLFTAQLWFMVGGAQSVEIAVNGSAGKGRVVVPVNAVATAVLDMPRGLGILLAVLGGTLILLLASIVGGAVRESVLPPGETVSPHRRDVAQLATGGALFVIVGILWFGRQWWAIEARDYRTNRLFQPVETKARVTPAGELSVQFGADLLRRNGPLVPDHGKLMHLFLVREPALDAFGHLHPAKTDWHTFTTGLPSLPAGRYTLYGDITYESGFSDTLFTTIELPGATNPRLALDRDDAWVAGPASTSDSYEIPGLGVKLKRRATEPLTAKRETRLRFAVEDPAGKPLAPEPYMGMAGHLIVRKDDGKVFTHLHPSGSFSMAAQQLFELRIAGNAPLRVASYTNDPICKLPLTEAGLAKLNELSFPYAFPSAGKYRLWVQTRVRGEIATAVYDVAVQ